MKILNRKTQEIIFEDDSKTIKETVEKAVKQKINLLESDLLLVYLQEAYLQEDYLQGAKGLKK